MRIDGQEIILVGDRLLLRPEEGESVSRAGLILPATVADAEQVQAGRVVAVGPGVAMPPAQFDWSDAPSSAASAPPRWVAMQARVGDLALFRRKAGVEIRLRQDRFVVVPHDALLVILREGDVAEAGPPQ